jgi:hypothetical protein
MMKSQKVFWTGILLLAVLGLGACAQLATQQKPASLSAQAGEQEEQREKVEADKG